MRVGPAPEPNEAFITQIVHTHACIYRFLYRATLHIATMVADACFIAGRIDLFTNLVEII